MNKQAWIDAFNQVVQTVLQNPAEPIHYWSAAVGGFLLLAWVFIQAGERLDVANVEGFSGFVAAAIGTAAMLAAMTAATLFVAPFLKIPPNLIFLLVVAVLASVVVTAPVIRFWTQAKFSGIVIAWLVSLAAAMAIVVAIGMGFAAAKGGQQQFQRGQLHNRDVREVLDAK